MSFYLGILFLMGPWLLMLAGAMRSLLRRNTRLRRLQAEGAAILTGGTLAKWAVYDPYFGLIHETERTWPYWFARGESGYFWIGLLLVFMGVFLDRRPRPGLTPWPRGWRTVSLAFIIGGSLAALIGVFVAGIPWGDKAWSVSRLWFTFGCYPFALMYLIWNPRQTPEVDPD